MPLFLVIVLVAVLFVIGVAAQLTLVLAVLNSPILLIMGLVVLFVLYFWWGRSR